MPKRLFPPKVPQHPPVAPDQQGMWTRILGYLGKAIDVVCMFKDKIMGLFGQKRKLFMRRNRRLFLQGKKLKKFDFRNIFHSVFNSIKDHWNLYVPILKAGKDYLVDGIHWAQERGAKLINYIKTKLETIFKPVLDLLESLKAKFIGWLLESPYMKKYALMINCLLAVNGVRDIAGLFGALTGFLPALAALATPIGWANLLVNLICGWENLKNAVESFKLAWSNTTDLKFNYYGKALGYIIATIAG